MHDRRINDEVVVFGNHGALWMNAMTWYDHATGSIWSQPWGRALTGEMRGTQLQIIPFSLVPWATWRNENPDTLALVGPDFNYGQQFITDDFVIGVAIGDAARGYYYTAIADSIVINDRLGDIPLLIHTNPDTREVRVFVRQLNDGTELTFTGDTVTLIDDQTGSIWQPRRGLAIEGDLVGEGLREIPYISSFDWAWLDFYPLTDYFGSR